MHVRVSLSTSVSLSPECMLPRCRCWLLLQARGSQGVEGGGGACVSIEICSFQLYQAQVWPRFFFSHPTTSVGPAPSTSPHSVFWCSQWFKKAVMGAWATLHWDDLSPKALCFPTGWDIPHKSISLVFREAEAIWLMLQVLTTTSPSS